MSSSGHVWVGELFTLQMCLSISLLIHTDLHHSCEYDKQAY